MIHKSAWVEYVPLGVIGVISPWNYPIILPAVACLQALAAGNAVVLKPSEYATRTGAKLAEIWNATGAIPHTWSILTGGPDAAQSLIAAGVDKVSFTGGAAGGRAVLRACAESLTPVIMELGGSDAMIVAADADLVRAAHAAVWGAFFNAGQSCIGVRRCFVDARVAKEFAEHLLSAVEKLKQGAADSTPAPDLCSVRTQRQIEQLESVVNDALERGAHLSTPRYDSSMGMFYPPTVLREVHPHSRLLNEEVFGPILALISVSNTEEAVARANACRFGLGGSIWSGNAGSASQLAKSLNVGGVAINDCLVQFAVPGLPFGGVKESGFGRSHGREGLMEFVSPKAFVRHRFGPRFEPYWFGASNRRSILDRFRRLLHGRSIWERFTALFK